MKNETKHLLNDDVPSLLKQIAIPASTGMFFNTMYNVVDTFYAGLISTEAISALSLSFMIFFIFSSSMNYSILLITFKLTCLFLRRFRRGKRSGVVRRYVFLLFYLSLIEFIILPSQLTEE